MPNDARTPSALKRRLPNLLTIFRLVLALAIVAALSFYRFSGEAAWALPTALVLFIVAAISDALDGYLARRWNAVTLFGRVVDPAADKLLVLGTLIMMACPPFLPADGAGVELDRVVTGVEPWMVVVILGRELIVSSLRAVLESERIDFSAVWAGKIKMILQSASVPLGLLIVWLSPAESLGPGGAARLALDALFWAVTLATIASSAPYALRMLAHIGDQRDDETLAEEIKG